LVNSAKVFYLSADKIVCNKGDNMLKRLIKTLLSDTIPMVMATCVFAWLLTYDSVFVYFSFLYDNAIHCTVMGCYPSQIPVLVNMMYYGEVKSLWMCVFVLPFYLISVFISHLVGLTVKRKWLLALVIVLMAVVGVAFLTK